MAPKVGALPTLPGDGAGSYRQAVGAAPLTWQGWAVAMQTCRVGEGSRQTPAKSLLTGTSWGTGAGTCLQHACALQRWGASSPLPVLRTGKVGGGAALVCRSAVMGLVLTQVLPWLCPVQDCHHPFQTMSQLSRPAPGCDTDDALSFCQPPEQRSLVCGRETSALAQVCVQRKPGHVLPSQTSRGGCSPADRAFHLHCTRQPTPPGFALGVSSVAMCCPRLSLTLHRDLIHCDQLHCVAPCYSFISFALAFKPIILLGSDRCILNLFPKPLLSLLPDMGPSPIAGQPGSRTWAVLHGGLCLLLSRTSPPEYF